MSPDNTTNSTSYLSNVDLANADFNCRTCNKLLVNEGKNPINTEIAKITVTYINQFTFPISDSGYISPNPTVENETIMK